MCSKSKFEMSVCVNVWRKLDGGPEMRVMMSEKEAGSSRDIAIN